ncbi:hypothetical protein KIF59_12255 [Enterobacter cloacae subsp. cloacae]|nr:hypothetical protein [Enterobacter cloacae subsp. cloacae]
MRQLTENSRITDAGVYDEKGDLIARAGEHVDVRDRLALDGKKPGATLTSRSSNLFRAKMVRWGICALTLDTHTLPTEAKQVDNTTNILPSDAPALPRHWRGTGPHLAAGQAHLLAAVALPADRQ